MAYPEKRSKRDRRDCGSEGGEEAGTGATMLEAPTKEIGVRQRSSASGVSGPERSEAGEADLDERGRRRRLVRRRSSGPEAGEAGATA